MALVRAARRALAVLATAAALAGCSPAGLPRAQPGPAAPPAPGPELPAMPEGGSGLQAKPGWTFQRQAVAAAHPLAAQAGAQVLREGGSAVDALVAVQAVLAVVEPQSSGIGGGAFLLLWDGQAVQAWDGRETAPAVADEGLFLQPDGRPLPMAQAQVGGRAVGVPGVLRLLQAVHQRHGRLPWARLLQPAVDLAEQGFALGHRLHTQLAEDAAIRRDPMARALYFGPDGQPWPVGTRLRNPALAQVLRQVAAQGAQALHQGPVAQDIVRRVQGHATNPGLLSLADLAAYQPRQRAPLCTDWGAHWRVCGMPPPSSGHLAVMQVLGLLQAQGAVAAANPLAAEPDADWLHQYTESARLAFADRAQHVADPDFVPAPAGRWDSLLDPDYLARRARLIGPRSLGTAGPGQPGGQRSAWAAQPDQPEHGTSHVSIVDAQGHALAFTTSIEAVFGARLMSDGGTGLPGGFLLNNQLTDFALAPHDAQGRPVANRVQPGKRPRSSMSPTLVFDRRDGRLHAVLGSPGGPAIIHFTAKTLLGTLAWGLDAQRAVDLPNFGSFNGPTVLEAGRFSATVVQALQARGHTVQPMVLTSGVQALVRGPGGWQGGADPRREGVVVGD